MNFRSFMSWRVAGLLSAMLIIVGLPYVVTRLNTQDTVLANSWVTHSTEVRSVAYRIAYLIRSSEAATYRMLVGDVGAETRAEAESSAAQVPELLQQLRAMTRDNPAQQSLIGALENSVTGRLTLMARARELQRQGDVGRAGQASSRELAHGVGSAVTVERVERVVPTTGKALSKPRGPCRQTAAQSVNNTALVMAGLPSPGAIYMAPLCCLPRQPL